MRMESAKAELDPRDEFLVAEQKRIKDVLKDAICIYQKG